MILGLKLFVASKPTIIIFPRIVLGAEKLNAENSKGVPQQKIILVTNVLFLANGGLGPDGIIKVSKGPGRF